MAFPYHLVLPVMRAATFLGFFVTAVLVLLHLHRRDLIALAAVFLIGLLLFLNQSAVVGLLGVRAGWLTTLVQANNKYGIAFTGLLFVIGPWAYLLARWPRPERRARRGR